MNNSVRKREAWIDVVKGLGIIFVVIGHVNTEGFLLQWIYTFHMPLFFALSGFLLKKFSADVSFGKFFLKRTQTILWPFVLFRVLLFIYWIVVESHFRPMDLGPIWFLIVLYIVELIAYPVLIKGTDVQSVVVKMICLALLLWISMIDILPVNFFTAWGVRCLNGLFWYIVGYQFGVVGGGEFKHNSQRAMVILGLFISSIITAYMNPGVSLWSNSYGKNFLLYIFGGIVGTMWLGTLCKSFISRNSFLELLGKNTITVLAVHEPIKRIVLKIIETIAHCFGIGITILEIQENTVCALGVVAIVVACSVGVITILRWIKSYMPLNVKNNWMGFIR